MKKKGMAAVLIVGLLCCLLAVETFAANMNFSDVPENAWYRKDVEKACRLGLINGKSDKIFAPNDNMSYAEAVKLAACMNQLKIDGKVTLKNGDPWYSTYVDYAFMTGIIWQEYDWNKPTTRADYMEIFSRALPEEDFFMANDVPMGSIPDVPISHPQAGAIYKLYRAGIVQGVDSAYHCAPDSFIKRAEVSAILSRMMDETERKSFSVLEKELSDDPDIAEAAAAAINRFSADAVLPGGLEISWMYMDSEDQYAIFDADKDGEEEFMIKILNAPVSDQIEIVYDYEDGNFKPILVAFPHAMYFKDGSVITFWSHATGLEGEGFWPLTFYQYDQTRKEYVRAGSAVQWEKAMRETDYNGVAFPDEADKDKDGIVYMIYRGEDDEWDGRYVDQAEYDAWVDSFAFEEENWVDVPWQEIRQPKG